MASGRDRQSPTLGLIPPPVAPPRRRSPVNFQGQETNPPDDQRKPPVPARRTSLPVRKDVPDGSLEERTDLSAKGKLPTLPEVDNRFSAPQLTYGYNYHPDLDGLDFSQTEGTQKNNVGESRPRSSSMEELKTNAKPIYPDIRHVFKDITIQSANPSLCSSGASQFISNNGSSLQQTSVRPTDGFCSTPPPLPSHSAGSYGWNAAFFANTSSYNNSGQYFHPQAINTGNIQYPPQSLPAPNHRFPSNNNFSLFHPASQVNFGPVRPYSSAAYDHIPFNNNNDMPTVSSSKFGYIPNISLPRPASCGEVFMLRESSASPTDNTKNPIAIAGFDESVFPVEATPQAVDGDLIKLGEALPEHEYLSLDYFDPLYSRGRKESVSYGDSSSAQALSRQTFSFGEAFPSFYMGHSHQSSSAYDQAKDDHIWMPDKAPLSAKSPPIGFEAFNFDEFGLTTFGSSEEEFLKGSSPIVFSSAAYDAAPAREIKRNVSEKPQRPPSWRVSQDKRFEGLRKRTFIDPESESFCQMVADLKKSYLSTDERTNQGYLINQIREYHTDTTSVKVTVYTQFSTEPVLFTCDTNSEVDLIISHVLYTVAPTDPQPDTNKYILKVYDRTEYLCNGLPLVKFDYVHSCQKLDKDICLELVSCEEVSRPFIRTRDDDIQMLYFPKEYINPDGTAVSQDALSVYLETFYHEIDVLMEHFSKGGNFHIQGLQQAVKALCVSLARIETVELTKTLDKLSRNVSELTSPSTKSQVMFGGSHQDKDSQEALSVAIRCSLLEDLQSTVDQLLDAVKRLVRMYCRTFLTDFFLGSSIDVPHDHLEVVKVKDNFIVSISSAHRIPDGWTHKYEEYKVVCSLYHGTKKMARDVSTTMKPLSTGLCERIYWDEWLNFEKMSLCTIPRETRLCLMLCGVTGQYGVVDRNQDKGELLEDKRLIYPLGAAAIQLFNEKGYLNQGPQLVPLMMGVSSDPIMPSCKTLLPDSVLLQVNLPEFDRTIFFQDPLNNLDSSSKSFDELTPMIRSLVYNVMEKEGCSMFTAEEYDTLWRYRHYMTEYPSLLPRILQAAQSWDWASLPEIYSLLRCWKPLHPMQAFELLLPEFPDLRVRQFAADSLNKISSDDLVDFLPQMIQGLKFESYHNSPLAKLLLEQACKSPRFAHQFFWLLKGAAAQDATFKRRYELMFVALASVAGDALYQEFKKQEELVKVMTSVAEKVKAAKDKDNTLKTELIPLHEMLEQKARVLLPYNPSVEVVGLDMKSCSYFTSNAFPLKLVFKNSNPKADSHYVIYKVGDDLRQDMLTLQMIRIMDNLWLQQGLDLKIILFSCLATGPKKGVIELVTESETLRKIQVSGGVTGSFKDRPIKEWLQKHNPTERDYLRAVENFTYSCAGYCVATYVLGVCDRHNDNIMLKQSGHMFHIDFSKFLGDAQMFGSFKRDRVPFVLTSDMAYVINDGGKQGHNFQRFVDLCCQAFNILRKHADLFRCLFFLMARSGIPGVTEHAVKYVQNALLPGQTDAQATATFTRMIEESMKSVFTQFNFFIHNLAQMKFSSHNEGTLLSFVPKAYSKETDGRITSVELTNFEKRYTPEKHYIFILKINRENVKLPTYVFRHFSEFVEFRDKLNEMFPLVTWPNYTTRLVIGRSNVRTVAESRKGEIVNFLKYLWSLTPEISECELVYTFFHPLLRDEQEAEKNKAHLARVRDSFVSRSNTAGNTGIKGEIKLSIQYKREALQVMVNHVKGLVESPEAPSPYVKTYLLPDPDKQTKLKTKIAKNTGHPIFNELLQYQLPEPDIKRRILQVTVWDSGMLKKDNNFLGAVYIKLASLDLSKENICWHKLGRIQMPNL